MAETATGGDEKLPTGSVTASWVQLDPKKSTDSTSSDEGTPPAGSDTDSNGETMTAELADASRSLYSASTSSEYKDVATPLTVEPTPADSPPCAISSLVPHVPAVLVTASVCLAVGFLVGRKLGQ